MRFLSVNLQAYSPKACVKVFDGAKETIKIILPDIAVNFFLDPKIIEALERAVKRGVAVKVAHGEFYEVGRRVGIFKIPEIEIFRTKRPCERLLVSIDAKHVIEETKPRLRKIEVGIIASGVANTLGHEVDAFFDEVTEAQK